MSALDYIGELELLLEALYELTQQLVDLSAYQDEKDRFNALDTARTAVEGKLKETVKDFEAFIRSGKEVSA